MTADRHDLKEEGILPRGWSREIRRAWDGLPADKRRALLRTIDMLPADADRLRDLAAEAGEHVQQALGDRASVTIVGPANVGKSTLYNQLLVSGQPQAEVGAAPGTTRQASAASAGVFTIVDTPGADSAGPRGEEERSHALRAAEEGDVLIAMFDAAHGVRPPEQGLMRELRDMQKPLVVALNKMDLVPRPEREHVRRLAEIALDLDEGDLLPISAKEGRGIEDLILAVARAEPGIVAALGAALPGYRWSLAQSVIARAASTSAAIAVTPIPIVDFVPLLAVQTSMVLSLARIYNYKLTLARARELLATFGAGLLGRTLFYELSKFGGPPGWLVAAGVAVGTTSALGYGSAVWFDRGAKLSGAELREVAAAVGSSVVERLRDLGRRRPDRRTLKERISGSLTEVLDRPDGPGESEET